MVEQNGAIWLILRGLDLRRPCCGLVVAASVADEDQAHQPDAEAECEDDPQSQREPTGAADLRVADGRLPTGDHETDRQDNSDSDYHRDQIPSRRSSGAHHFKFAAT